METKNYALYIKGKKDILKVESNGDIFLNENLIGSSHDIAEFLERTAEIFKKCQKDSEKFIDILSITCSNE